MVQNFDSLVEIAIKEMSKKRSPKSIAKIAKEVFEIKGLSDEEAKEALPQFEIDFMLCGNFICCGEDRKGVKLWDLKDRQPSYLLDKEGVYLEDPYDDDEDVKKHELKDEDVEQEGMDNQESSYDDDDDEEEETDDIEEELLLYEEEDEELEEESYDDDDNEIRMKRK